MTSHIQRITAAFVLTTLAVACTDCTTMRTIRPSGAPAAPAFGNVKAGDTVSVEMRDGRQARFEVSRIESDELVSVRNDRYRRSEIVVLKRRSFSGLKTGILVAGTSAGILFLVIAAAYGAAISGISGGI
jgi:hypothetical protein